MARGGYRPGAGRPKGSKNKAKKEKKDSKNKVVLLDDLTPLEYVLKTINDANASNDRKDRLAIAALPFCHERVDGKKGKKEKKTERAKRAGHGKFKSGKAPVKILPFDRDRK